MKRKCDRIIDVTRPTDIDREIGGGLGGGFLEVGAISRGGGFLIFLLLWGYLWYKHNYDDSIVLGRWNLNKRRGKYNIFF